MANGVPALEERQDLVYRDVEPGGGPPRPPAPAQQGTHSRPSKADPTLLFRYSALTFNGHRIHYDRRYVTQVEGYPGLVVHGPLQAALLCDYATELRGTPPRRFGFRGLAPLFDDDGFSLHAVETEGGLKLWTAKADGTVCMEAAAE
jgi:3-methylfumaryl-CoA hydratase